MALVLAAGGLFAESAPAEAQDRDRLISRDAMTPEERADYLTRLRAATTAGERERIRLDAERLMETRTRGLGATSSDLPRPGAGLGLSGDLGDTRRSLGEEGAGMERGRSGPQGLGSAESNPSGPLGDLATPGRAAGGPSGSGMGGGAAGGGGTGGGGGS